MTDKETKLRIEDCKTEINVFKHSAFLNIQLPNGRWITFETKDVDPPVKTQINVSDSTGEKKNGS